MAPNSMAVDTLAGEPAADDELASVAVGRLNPVAGPQPWCVSRIEVLADGAFKTQLRRRGQNCGGVGVGPAAN
jgi:hypothetical protein